MKFHILSASVEFIEQAFLKPMQISSGLICQATEARVAVTVRAGDRKATGRGSIYLSDLWAWPGTPSDRTAKEAIFRPFIFMRPTRPSLPRITAFRLAVPCAPFVRPCAPRSAH